MTQQVNIVGGGITGCVVALACSDQGWDVQLFEKSSELGGIMKDLSFADRSYFNGCHYFDRGTPWFEAVRGRLDVRFSEFPHRYGGITELNSKQDVQHDYAQPTFPGPAPQLPDQPPMPESLHDDYSVADRLRLFGPAISDTLLQWAEPYGDLERFHVSTARIMQLHRFFFPDDVEGVRARKHESAIADDMFGIPRTILAPGHAIDLGVLPESGRYADFFGAFQRLLEAQGVAINLKAPVVPVSQGNDAPLTFVSKGEALNADLTIWCTNPTGLFLKLCLGRLDAPVTRMYVLVGDLESGSLDVPAYYHGFSTDNPIMRLYAYDSEAPKLVIEAFDKCDVDAPALEQEARHAAPWIEAMGITGAFTPRGLVKQKRYQFFTIEDAKRFAAFADIAKRHKLVSGYWHNYSRDGKIAGILNELDIDFT